MKLKKLLNKNELMKPLSVITASSPPLIYLGATGSLFMDESVTINGQDFIAISEELAKSFQGAMILLVLLISIIYIYKPPKVVTWVLVLGGLALFSSALLETIGMVLVTYGLGLIFNSLTIDRVIAKNNLYNSKKLDREVDQILKEAKI